MMAGRVGEQIHVAVFLTPVLATRMAGVKGLQPRLEQCSLFGGLDAVGGQDRELVAAVLLAQAAHEVLAIVVLRQSRSGEQGDSEGDEGAGHFGSRLLDEVLGQHESKGRQEPREGGKNWGFDGDHWLTSTGPMILRSARIRNKHRTDHRL